MKVKMFPVINMEATGANILKLRKERNLSVADLQEYFGFDAPQAIYKWQRGETLPSTDNLLALGYLLGVPIDDILVSNAGSDSDSQPQDDSCGDCFVLEMFCFNYGFNDTAFSPRYNKSMKNKEETEIVENHIV